MKVFRFKLHPSVKYFADKNCDVMDAMMSLLFDCGFDHVGNYMKLGIDEKESILNEDNWELIG
jgi:hypothetical protein